VLLGVIEAFGGRLGRTDCLKILFLFGQQDNPKKHYAFFPHHYGPYSYVVMQDKRRLTAQGYLRDSQGFVLAATGGHVDRLEPSDRVAILNLATRLGSVRGRELLRKVYLEYPAHCCKSRVAAKVLSREELSRVSSRWNTDATQRLFTIGYEGRTIDDVLNCLVVNNVHCVIDVRRNALSMKYGFSKTALGQYLAASGLEYLHLPTLGIPSALRENLVSFDSYQRLFARYRTELLPNAGESLELVVQKVARRHRVALLCFEANSLQCHRHVVAEAVVAATSGLQLQHL
jgi:uncharacterized protein (DUF488 family)